MIFASRPNLLYTNPVYRPLTQDRVFGSGYRVVFTGNEVTSLIVYSADVDIDDVDTSSIYADSTLGIRQQSIRKRGHSVLRDGPDINWDTGAHYVRTYETGYMQQYFCDDIFVTMLGFQDDTPE